MHGTKACDDGEFWIQKDDFLARFQGVYGVKIPRQWRHKPVDRQESEAMSQCPSPREDEFASRCETITEEEISQALAQARLNDPELWKDENVISEDVS